MLSASFETQALLGPRAYQLGKAGCLTSPRDPLLGPQVLGSKIQATTPAYSLSLSLSLPFSFFLLSLSLSLSLSPSLSLSLSFFLSSFLSVVIEETVSGAFLFPGYGARALGGLLCSLFYHRLHSSDLGSAGGYQV